MVGKERINEARSASREEMAAEIERLRDLLDAHFEGAWSADPQGNLTEFSRRWLALTGFNRDVALTGKWPDATHPEDVDHVLDTWRNAVETGTACEVRHRIRGQDGSYRWMRSKALPRRNNQGEITGWVGTTEDIHDEIIGRQRLTSTADALPAMVFHLDRDFRYQFANRRVEETFGLPRDQFLGRTVSEVLGDQVFNQILPYLSRALSGERAEWGMWVRFPTGERFMRTTYVPSIDADRQTVGIDVLSIDETKLRLAQEGLERSERQQRFLAELSHAISETESADTIMEEVTRQIAQHLGVSRCSYGQVDEHQETFEISISYCNGVPPNLGPLKFAAFGETVTRLLQSGEPCVVNDVRTEFVEQSLWEAHEAIAVRAYILVPQVRAGRLVALMSVNHREPRGWTTDEVELVSRVADRCWAQVERARAERALRDLNEALEARVQERTSALTRANRDLEEFAYSVAHDLRSPLRAIVSTSRMLFDDLSDRLLEDERNILKRQERSALRLAQIVDDLLEFARLAGGEVRMTPVDLTELCREIGEEVASRWKREGDLRVDPGMRATGDARLIGYALTNLIENAFKFSPEGGPVHVGQEGGHFFVRDQGIGFEMQFAAKVFKAFERLVPQDSFPGSGVGLANVRRIVERHGGKVWAESEPGKGSTFFFTLSA